MDSLQLAFAFLTRLGRLWNENESKEVIKGKSEGDGIEKLKLHGGESSAVSEQ